MVDMKEITIMNENLALIGANLARIATALEKIEEHQDIGL